MNKFVALLRGINVGGHRKIKMADLKSSLQKTGFKNIQTYIQSGNIVFETELISEDIIGKKIEEIIMKDFGFEVPAIINSKTDFYQIYQQIPYERNESLYVVFLKDVPEPDNISHFNSVIFENEEFKYVNKAVYLKLKQPYHESKLDHSFIEKYLKVRATARNYKTIGKIVELL